ncbi:MAG: DUF2079 domain-containing protein [Victivallaceae bacterium]
MNYFLSAGFCLLIALAGAAGLMRLKFLPQNRRTEFRIVIIACMTFSLIYASLSCLRYYQMIYGLWDFGHYEDEIRNMAVFNGFLKGSGGYCEHFVPLIAFWVPFYWIWDSPYMLLIGQAVLLGAAGIPLYFCASRMLKAPGWPLLIVLMYLLNPYLSRFTLYEYHMGCFYPILFFSAWIAYLHHKKWLFLALLFSPVLAKESFCIVIIAVGLYLCSRRKSFKLGLTCLGLVVLTALFILYIWFPHIIPLHYQHVSRYPQVFGSSVAATFENIIKIAGIIFASDSLAVTISLLLPFAFLPLLSWRIFFLLFMPVALSQICSVHGHQHLIMSHYSDVLIPLLPLAALLALVGVKRFKNCTVRQRQFAFALCFTLPLTANIMYCEMPQLKYHCYIPVYRPERQLGIMSLPFNTKVLSYPRAGVFHAIKDSIPLNYSVCAQNNLAVFFMRHKAFYWLTKPENPDFYVFDLKSFDGFDSVEVLHALIKKVATDPGYVNIYNVDGFLVFCRKSLLPKQADTLSAK